VGPQIHKLFRDVMFNSVLQSDDKKAWDAFRLVSADFLGNIRAENYKELIEDMLSLYHKLGRNMSLMINILHSHLDFFPDNCGMFSNEHGELSVRKLQRWRNDIREIGPLPCWLARNAPEQLFKRQAKRIRKYKWTFIATCLMYTYLKCILNVC
jgi:hypothetical protein